MVDKIAGHNATRNKALAIGVVLMAFVAEKVGLQETDVMVHLVGQTDTNVY